MDHPNTMTRRRFLAATSCLGAGLWAARLFPVTAMAKFYEELKTGGT
jgi:hypothetical protein